MNPTAPVPPATLAERITAQLAVLQPQQLELSDDSGNHAGHAGWREGGSHFRVRIVSAQFAGHPRVERHRMVYAALGTLMQERIHAMAIDARTPDEL